MAPINLKPSSKGVTMLIIVAAVLFVGCVLGYVAAAGKLNSASKQLAAKTKEVNESEQIAQKLEKSKLEYLDAGSQLRYLESSVSTQAYVPTLLKQLEYLGKSTNLKVLGVKPEKPKPKPIAAAPSSTSSTGATPPADETATKEVPKPYDELTVEVEAEGNYMNVLDFIYKLTSFPKIMLVNNVDVAPLSQTQGIGSPKLNVKMNVTAFVFKSEKLKAKPKADINSSAVSKNMKCAGRSGNDAG